MVPISYTGGETLPRNPDGSFQTTYNVNFNDAWAEMEKLPDRGKVSTVGGLQTPPKRAFYFLCLSILNIHCVLSASTNFS